MNTDTTNSGAAATEKKPGLNDLARLFADAVNSRKEVTLSTESCALLYAAMTTPPAAPAAGMREAFQAWCPYKGAPDPWRVWQDAWAAALATVPSPAAAKESDPLDMPLPCDVTIGGGTLHKGVRLRALVLRAQGLHRMLMEHMPKPDPQAVAQFQELLKHGPDVLDAAQQDSAQVAGKDGAA